MINFDAILPVMETEMKLHSEFLNSLPWAIINRDLTGRVRLILPDLIENDSDLKQAADKLAERLSGSLHPHSYPSNSMLLYESDKEHACEGSLHYMLDGFQNLWVVDRLATEANWADILDETQEATRVVFFSIKGGVGRSTSLAATAWSLAQSGKRVLVLDLDLESPGLSAALLPPERQPKFGITDWLVEDLVDNSDVILEDMIATSNLSHDGEIFVVPAHGEKPGEYISKLGRVWMPKVSATGEREAWSTRLRRLIEMLERRLEPDAILIDSRSGIDEIASTCISGIGANLILLFSIEGEQTWNGYRMLFEQWQRARVAEDIRGRLQVVGALVPEMDKTKYVAGLRERSYQVFLETLYDEIAPAPIGAVGENGESDGKWRVLDFIDGWNFDEADEGAPHYPWIVNWHRSFAGIRSLQGRLNSIDPQDVDHIFGPLLEGIRNSLTEKKQK